MSPKEVMKQAASKDISIVAITDHNSMANCRTYAEAASQFGLNYIYGIEIQTIEEIHIIALFDDVSSALSLNDLIYQNLLPVKNNPDFFGDQVIIDSSENIIAFEEKALINSVIWDLEATVEMLRDHNSFYYPAHIDAGTYSILSQLGFIPPELNFPALEVTAKCDLSKLRQNHPSLKDKVFIRSSDAHYIQDVGSGFTEFLLEEPTLKEIRLACQKIAGRNYVS